VAGASHHVRVFAARMSQLPEVVGFTARVCDTADVGRDACLRLALLVEELFTNTVAHGHGQDSEAPVTIALEVTPARIRLVYEDTGPAYDPFAQLAPPHDAMDVDERAVGGLGIVLIAAMARDVEYRRADGKNRIALVIAGAG
jgi:serine/threonine-protein kinase RsbW